MSTMMVFWPSCATNTSRSCSAFLFTCIETACRIKVQMCDGARATGSSSANALWIVDTKPLPHTGWSLKTNLSLQSLVTSIVSSFEVNVFERWVLLTRIGSFFSLVETGLLVGPFPFLFKNTALQTFIFDIFLGCDGWSFQFKVFRVM